MKRVKGDRQLRPEEVEAQEDEEEEAGTFSRASSETLAGRKIIRVKRSSESSRKPLAVTSSSASTVTTTNPFGGFGGLTKSQSSAPINPFGGFGGLTNPSTSSMNKGNIETDTSGDKFDARKKSDNEVNEYKKRIGKLNKSFLSWIEKQATENMTALWTEGSQDYVKFAREILKKYGDDTVPSGLLTNNSFSMDADPPSSSSPSISAPPSTSFSTSGSGVGGPVSTVSVTGTASSFSLSSGFNQPVPSTTLSSSLSTSTSATITGFKFNVPASNTFSSSVSSSSSVPGSGFSWSTPATSLSSSSSSSSSLSTPSFSGFGNFNMPTNSSSQPSNNMSLGLGMPPSTSFTFSGFGGGVKLDTGASAADGDGEGDDQPILPPEVVLKNDEDTDEVLHEVACKLFRFDKDGNEWKESGKGTLRITKDIETKKRRILIRNVMGKVTLNSPFYKGMKFEKMGKNGIRFTAVAGANSELKTVMTRLKVEDVDSTLKSLVDSVNDL